MRNLIVSAIVAAGMAIGATSAQASGGAPLPPEQNWSFQGVFGTYDQNQLRRGFKIYNQVCSACHSMNLVAYRNLADLGFTEDEIKEIAAEREVPAGPDEFGEVLEDGAFRMRPAEPTDHFVPPYPNEQAARSMNGGALPPDLSLMVKARKHGPDYVYALLTGYADEPSEAFLEEYKAKHGKEFKLQEGRYFNKYFAGHNISMAPPLFDEAVEYEDGTPMTLEQHAKDVVTFLAWTAMPELPERHRMGIKVLLYLLVLTGMMYALKRKIWSDVH